MAEATGLRNNALPYPVYGVPFGITFPLLDADGDPISPSSPDSERSLNGDTFADCTNEATEIATSSGICYLLLTAAEMTADVVTVRIQSTGAKTTVITLYPAKLPVLSSGTCQGSNDTGDITLASSEPALNDIYNGCLCVATIDTVVEARLINDYVGSSKVAEIAPAWNTAQPDSNDTYVIYAPLGRAVTDVNVAGLLGTAWLTPGTAGTPDVNTKLAGGTAWGSGAITAASIATDAIDADALADGAITAATFAAGAIDASAIAADAIGASELAADAATEIATAVWASADRQLTALDEDATTIDLNATTIGTVTTLTNLPAITANWLTAAGLAADAATEIAAAVLAAVVTGTTTVAQSLILLQAFGAGKASGLGTSTAVYRDIADTTDVITATVDASGNRTVVVIVYP